MIDELKDKKIMWISDGPDYPSGFSIISRQIAFYLAREGMDVSYLHPQKAGLDVVFNNKMFEDVSSYDYSEIKILASDGDTFKFGEATFDRHLTIAEKYYKKRFDIVATLMDLHMSRYVAKYKEKHWYKWINYTTLDGEIFPKHWIPILDKIDYIVSMSKFATEIFEENGYFPTYIPHGTNTKYWIKDKGIGDYYRKSFGYESDDFIIINVNRNQHRKDFPSALMIYKKFLEGLPKSKQRKVKFYFHCDPFDYMGWNMYEMFDEFGLKKENVKVTNMKADIGMPTDFVKGIYNMGDVFLNTNTGEGFGVTTLESMSCGCPVIITDYTTAKELVGDTKSGICVPYDRIVYLPHKIRFTPAAYIDIDKGVKALQYMYDNPSERKKFSGNAITSAKNYDWDEITPMWSKLIKEVL